MTPADPARALDFLIGTWRGEGVGAVPGGDGPDYPYAEVLRIHDDGSSWLAYTSHLVTVDDGSWLHSESGWWRPQPPAEDGSISVELVVTRPSGVTEVLIGALKEGPAGPQVELVSDVVARTPSAPPITADRRLYAVRAGKLMYAIDLAAGDTGLVPHLAAALDRSTD
jgi:hypothetical protein